MLPLRPLPSAKHSTCIQKVKKNIFVIGFPYPLAAASSASGASARGASASGAGLSAASFEIGAAHTEAELAPSEEEPTTGKQLTRVFNGPNHVEEHTDDIAMINTINFDDLLLGEAVSHSTSTAPMDMIEEEVENLTIEKNTVPLPEDTTNIMDMIENASFDFTLPEPFPTTTLHITEQKTEVEQMVEVI